MFLSRKEAGRVLGKRLAEQKLVTPFVLGIPRGGVVVACKVAALLHCPLDSIVTKKIKAPHDEELAIGAVDRDGTIILNEMQTRLPDIPQAYLDRAAQAAQTEMICRENIIRGNRPMPNLEGKTVVLVDDGIATGATMLAAVGWVRKRNPAKIVLAVPVALADSLDRLRSKVDESVVLMIPSNFYAVGQSYVDFRQVSDEEVKRILTKHGSY